MRRVVLCVMGIVIGLCVVFVGGAFFLRLHAKHHASDWGGMENPYASENSQELLDGEYTYVDNEALLQIIAGDWEDENHQLSLTLDESYQLQLTYEDGPSLHTTIYFTYLQPGEPLQTELYLTENEVCASNGLRLFSVAEMVFLPGQTNQIGLTLEGDDSKESQSFLLTVSDKKR